LKTSNSKKIKRHGGARKGAGRKPKQRASAVPLRLASSDTSAQERARAYVDLAIETLASVAGEGASEAARVAAARVIVEIETGKAKAAPATDPHQDDADGWDGLVGRQSGRAN
jgi:hypothetical protein